MQSRGMLWPALAETFGVETGPDMPTSVTTYLENNADVWNRIVAKYDLRSRNLRELVGYGDQTTNQPARIFSLAALRTITREPRRAMSSSRSNCLIMR
jgi:hypothetical protein